MTIILPDESYTIMGACFEVYKEKGCGFLGAVYQECLEIEFAAKSIPFRSHPVLCPRLQGSQAQKQIHPRFHLL